VGGEEFEQKRVERFEEGGRRRAGAVGSGRVIRARKRG
jgi:hypothetical protein